LETSVTTDGSNPLIPVGLRDWGIGTARKRAAIFSGYDKQPCPEESSPVNYLKAQFNEVRKKLKAQMRHNIDRDVRIKAEFLLVALKTGNISEACRRKGFSRKFFYKWWGRLEKAKLELSALQEKSRRPKSSPGKIPRSLELRIHALHRRQNGSRMIEGILRAEGIKVSRSVICHVLNDRKPAQKSRRQKLKAHRRRYELTVPGQRIQIDVKYVPEKVGGEQIYVYSAVDEATRWRFAWASPAINEHMTVEFLKRLKENCPFPIFTVQTDNGQEFTFRLLSDTRAHLMDKWCAQNNIKHRCIPPGEKELNGKVERAHRIDEQYFYWHAPTKNLLRFNDALRTWIAKYNDRRLHGGINFMTPMAKLEERFKVLQTPLPDEQKHLEGLRLMFIEKYPLMKKPEGRQLLNLEAEIKKLQMVS
jgi:transposase InsO family protein